MKLDEIKKTVRTIPNWPKKGIMFKDITTLLNNSEAFKSTCNLLYEHYKNKGVQKVAGIESRGFIFGSVLAEKLSVGFVPIRKPGKLPAKTIKEEYELEYGTDCIEIHEDAIKLGEKVVIIDDLIATGGTAKAALNLVRKIGGEVLECAFIIDLTGLGGKEKLDCPIFTMMEFKGE